MPDALPLSVIEADETLRLLRDSARGFLAEGLRLARDRSDKRVTAECVQGLAAAAAGEGR